VTVGVIGHGRRTQANLLLVGQRFDPGVQRPADPIQRIANAASVPGGCLLDSLAAHGELARGQAHHV
jgi:hypothetical protein